ncbi:MAG: HD-GYP domain-containing protein [Phycisphaerales bacterium]
MSVTQVQPASRPAHVTLRDRCRELGIPVWRYSAQGHILAAPNEAGVAGQWLRAPGVERLIEKQVKRWVGGESEPESEKPAEVFPGCVLVPLVESHRRRRRALSVAMLLGPAALEAEQFTQMCQSAALDLKATRKAMTPWARFAGGGAESAASGAASMLAWMHTDLLASTEAQRDLTVFSRQLSESYEEINLLYRLGQSMNELEAPLRFVRLACDELHAVLAFGWIAAYFLPECPDGRSLQNEVVLSGEGPCGVDMFRAEAERVIRGLIDYEKVILEADSAGALIAGGEQVLVHPVVNHGVVVGAILAGAKRGEDKLASSSDLKMLGAAAGSLGVLLENAGLYEDQQSMFLGTLQALVTSIDAKDPYTCGHSERVAYLAATLAGAAGLPREACERIRIAGLVHDVGKIGVPEAVLCKPGKLTDDEFGLVKKHPEIGHLILSGIKLMDDVLPGVLYHHERYDGRGYPHQRKGDDIPQMARIIGLVDAFDAMSSNRTYRAAMNREKVLDEIRKGAGTQFDPVLAEAFLTLDLAQYDEMVARHHQLALSGDDRFGRRGMSAPSAPPAPPASAPTPAPAGTGHATRHDRAQPCKEAA